MLSKFNRNRRNSSTLPALGQVLMADFRFKIGDSVTQAARLTKKIRQVTAERYEELPRRHILYRLNWTKRFVTRLSYHSLAGKDASRIFMQIAYGILLLSPPSLPSTRNWIAKIEDYEFLYSINCLSFHY